MELSILKSELISAISLTQSLTEKKTTRPILNNFLLNAKDGKLFITASDLETSAVATCDAKVVSSGSTTVQGRIFADLIRELPDTEINLKLMDGERLDIVAGTSKMRVVCSSANDYPGLAGLQVSVKNKVDSKQLGEMISKTLYAASTDETRFNLNGVCMEKTAGEAKLRMVATDGHRLSVISREIGDFVFEPPATGTQSVICPRKGLAEAKKIIDNAEFREKWKEIGLAVKEGFFVLETPNFKMAFRLIDGEFPDYSQVIPKQKGNLILVDSEEFMQTLKRVALLVSDKNKSIRIDIADNNLKISSSSPELGDAVENTQVKYNKEQISVGYNARYLIDFCASLEEKTEMAMEMSPEFGPGKFYALGDESYFSVVMPLRVTE